MVFVRTAVKVPRLMQVTPATCELGIYVLLGAYEGKEYGILRFLVRYMICFLI